MDSAEYGSIAHQVAQIDTGGKRGITLQEKYKCLEPLESYIQSKCKEYGIELSFDVTAKELPYFETINYTTYAGFLIIHPLSPEQALRQSYDAYADNHASSGHIEYLKGRIESGEHFGKYDIKGSGITEGKKALVVLSGGNKLKKHSCIGKLNEICKKHGGDNVLMKKHPMSYDHVYDELEQAMNEGFWYANPNEDLHNLMKEAEYVYTSMLSETALIAHILGKKVNHYDLFQNRETAPFYHINYFLFTTPDPLAWADRTFASPKSGVIHPDVDKDWKGKIDKYFDYIMELRSFYKDAYIWR